MYSKVYVEIKPSSWDPTVPYGTIEEAVDRHMNIKNFYGGK